MSATSSPLGHAMVVALELESLGYRYLITDQDKIVTIHIVAEDDQTLGRDAETLLDLPPEHVARMLIAALDARQAATFARRAPSPFAV